jgi:hypothetical protein
VHRRHDLSAVGFLRGNAAIGKPGVKLGRAVGDQLVETA